METSTPNDNPDTGGSPDLAKEDITAEQAKETETVGTFQRRWLKFSKFITNYQIIICISLGMLGFVYASCLLVSFFNNDAKPYGGVILPNRTELVDSLLSKRLNSLNGINTQVTAKQQRLEKEIAKMVEKATLTVLKKDTLSKIPAEQSLIAKAMADTRREKLLLAYRDTAASQNYYLKYIHFEKKAFTDTLHGDGWLQAANHEKRIAVRMIDDHPLYKNGPISYTASLILKQDKRHELTAFAAENPAFGLWIVFTIGQMMLWLLLLPILSANMLNLKEPLAGEVYQISATDRAINTFLPLIFMGIFCYFFYVGLADSTIIRDDYFFTSYNNRMRFYAIPGYLISSFCFTSFLTMSRHFDNLNTESAGKKTVITSDEFAKKFLAIKKAFDNSFTCSAIILSLFVFWAGLLIYSLNSTQAFQYYQKVTGTPLIPSDFVYLMGLLHTLILLTFYIPIKLRFNALQITQPEEMKISQVPNQKPFEAMLAGLGTVLINISPILAAVVQQLFKLFFDSPNTP
ncbi:hypothetical protein SRABI27_03738 [Pedobacter sp. Bi27]|uniref:hypothetical protein n=1 Tax=Pedobacter sp. Bi27 TaxID=2822351 RepID=UPI001DCC78D4|nr:hypothetical protein [Pedobacter sp. Bi27]CAH0279699.1 hypothetical protein SRABI27_03738 [Pedobacter sp. Bi27]